MSAPVRASNSVGGKKACRHEAGEGGQGFTRRSELRIYIEYNTLSFAICHAYQDGVARSEPLGLTIGTRFERYAHQLSQEGGSRSSHWGGGLCSRTEQEH